MRSPLIFVSVVVLVSTGVFDGGNLLAQETQPQSITLEEIKITLGVSKDELFHKIDSTFWMLNMTPATEVSVRKGYEVHLVFRKDDVLQKDLMRWSDPVGELAFQDGVLVLAVKFWLRPGQRIADRLTDAYISLTENVPDCPAKPPVVPNTRDTVEAPLVCGYKSLRIYDQQIEETLKGNEEMTVPNPATPADQRQN